MFVCVCVYGFVLFDGLVVCVGDGADAARRLFIRFVATVRLIHLFHLCSSDMNSGFSNESRRVNVSFFTTLRGLN